MPVLGVCLGHQCIVEVYGGVVERARRLMHGKVGTVDRIEPDALLDGLPESFEAGRYHSLAAIEPLPEVLIATARDRDGEVMALRHRDIAPARRAVPPRVGAHARGRRDRAKLPRHGEPA